MTRLWNDGVPISGKCKGFGGPVARDPLRHERPDSRRLNWATISARDTQKRRMLPTARKPANSGLPSAVSSGVLNPFPCVGHCRLSGGASKFSRNQNIQLDRKAALRPTCVSEDT